MKLTIFNITNLKIILILLIIGLYVSKFHKFNKFNSLINMEKTDLKNYMEESRTMDSYKAKSRDYVIFARLPYCSSTVLLGGGCNLCQEIQKKGFSIIEILNKSKDNIDFSLIVSKNNEELIFSFGGPKSHNIEYFEKIYSTGFKIINDTPIENEFWYIYENFYKSKIISNLEKFKEETNLKIIFMGHSFGGSLAQLAAWDLVTGKVLSINDKGPFIITFGALKIGPKNFFELIKDHIQIPVLRVARRVDLFSLLPRCLWLPSLGVFHCYKTYSSFIQRFPIFTNYYLNYSPISKSHIIKIVPNDVLNLFQNKYVIKHYNPHIVQKIEIKTDDKAPYQKNQAKNQSNEQIKSNIQNEENKSNKNDDLLNNLNKGKNNEDIVTINDTADDSKSKINKIQEEKDKSIDNEKPQDNRSSSNKFNQSQDENNLKLEDQSKKSHIPNPSISNMANNFNIPKDVGSSINNKINSNNILNSPSTNIFNSAPIAYSGPANNINLNHPSSLSNSHSVNNSRPKLDDMDIKHFRFIQKKADRMRNTMLFSNQFLTESLTRYCSSYEDYLSCKFNFADHKKFYGIDIESCN